jgi:hypothetical protein
MFRLPLSESPIVCYSSHANALSILSNDEDYLPWFHSNYIHFSCLEDFARNEADVQIDFYLGVRKDFNYYANNPWLFHQCIERTLLDGLTGGDLIAFIISALHMHNYVDLILNEYHIPDRNAYQTRYFEHENLIYGYDLKERTFDIAGFNRNRKFSTMKVAFDQVVEGYTGCNANQWGKQVVYLIKHEKYTERFKTEYAFNLPLVVHSLEEYLAGTNVSDKFAMLRTPKSKMAFGINVYPVLIENLSKYWHWNDMRPLHILWEHKKCMHERLLYIKEKGYLSENDFAKLAETS